MYSLIFPPLVVWFIGKVAGPDRWPWFYRRPGRCVLTSDGVRWHTEMPFAKKRNVSLGWADIVWVEPGHFHLWVVGQCCSGVTRVAADVSRLKPIDAREDWSFAQALVHHRPDMYVLTDPVTNGQQSGARLRNPHEPPSVVTPIPLSRARPVTMALFMAFVFNTGLVEALLRR